MSVPIPQTLRGQLNLKESADGRYEISIPHEANIAADSVGRHAAGSGAECIALITERADGSVERLTYGELDRAACRFASGLAALGIGRGERVAIHLGQASETAIAHLAVYKLGAIVVTISELHGVEIVEHILADSGSGTWITTAANAAKLEHARSTLAHLRHVIVTDGAPQGTLAFSSVAPLRNDRFHPTRTLAEDAALLIYSSGSTGRPKGVLHAHRVLWAYNLSTTLFYNLEMDAPDLVFWTPADWAWVGGWNDTVLPAWFHGHAVVASRRRFEAIAAYELMARHGVTHSFMTATALRRLALVDAPRTRWPDLRLRTVWTGGEPLPGETLAWLTGTLGVTCNEGYGLTEVNHMIGNCARLRPPKPGSMGYELPGHWAHLVDEEGREVATGEVGEIVTREACATLCLGYWGQPEMTRGLRLGQWVRTGDLAVQDADGYFFYRGRRDDLIKSAGFRIGPAEVEDCLLAHPAVAECGVIGVPDAARGEAVKAFVRLRSPAGDAAGLIDQLKDHVRARIGGFKVPREIAIVGELPLTTSGKVSRRELRAWHARGAHPASER